MYTHTDGTKFGTGAVVTKTISNMPTLGMSTLPFDWNAGFSVPELVTKDQGLSYSCGGQALAYKGEAETGVPKSAKFPYSQVFVRGGGSGEASLIKIKVTEGLCDEAVLPSYQNGAPPSESFMEDSSVITPIVLDNARTNEGVTVYVNLNFEAMAQAVRDNGGIIIGVYGENNGSWVSGDPLPPKSKEWSHWLYAGKALMRNGRRVIGFKNSWGPIGDAGTGWQYITEDYLPFIWSAWTVQKGSGYKFNNNLSLLMNNEDVFALQARLGITPTGFFGLKTLNAVMTYQKAHGIMQTGTVGPLSRASLNS